MKILTDFFSVFYLLNLALKYVTVAHLYHSPATLPLPHKI